MPKQEQQEQLPEEECDPRFEVIHQLIDYCRFRQAAKELAERGVQQKVYNVPVRFVKYDHILRLNQ